MHRSEKSERLIGRLERGFDFLSYHFIPAGLKITKHTITNFIEKVFLRRVLLGAFKAELLD